MYLKKRNHYSFISLVKAFQNPQELEQYKRKLGFLNAMANYSAKI